MDENVTTIWASLRGKAVAEWQATVEADLYPALEERGVKVNSKAILDPVPGNETQLIWFCSTEEFYLEISLHSANAFSGTVIKGEQNFLWPGSPNSLYDRKNYTIRYLLEWIDQWIA